MVPSMFILPSILLKSIGLDICPAAATLIIPGILSERSLMSRCPVVPLMRDVSSRSAEAGMSLSMSAVMGNALCTSVMLTLPSASSIRGRLGSAERSPMPIAAENRSLEAGVASKKLSAFMAAESIENTPEAVRLIPHRSFADTLSGTRIEEARL